MDSETNGKSQGQVCFKNDFLCAGASRCFVPDVDRYITECFQIERNII